MKVAGLLAFFLGFLASASLAGRNDRVHPGRWGGLDIYMEVRAFSADIDFDCAHGRIEQPITLNRFGEFDVPGVYVEDGPGPIQGGDRPARYTGNVRGKNMRVTVILTDTGEIVGPFTLIRGEPSSVVKCL